MSLINADVWCDNIDRQKMQQMNEILNLPCVQFSCSLEFISYFFFMNRIFLPIVNLCFFFKEISKKLLKRFKHGILIHDIIVKYIFEYQKLNLGSV